MKKIVVADYDGTLFRNGLVSKDDLNAIHRFRKQGGMFGIATGRIVTSIKKEVNHYGIPVDFVISGNGAITLNDEFEVLDSIEIETEKALEVFKYLKNSHARHWSMSDGFGIYREGAQSPYSRFYAVDKEQVLKNRIRALYGRFYTREESLAVADYINTHFKEYVEAMPNFSHLDIASSKANKATSLRKYIETYVPNSQVVTIGDAHNDLRMLQEFNGFVMRDGDPLIVKSIQRRVHSVKEAIEKFMNELYTCK